MNPCTFNKKAVGIIMLVVFLGTPISAFAQLTSAQSQQLLTLVALQQSGAISPAQVQQLLLLQQLQQPQQQPGQPQSAFDPTIAMALMMQGGQQQGGQSGQGGGQNPSAMIGQALTIAGLLSGNMGLVIAGMLTSMMGSLAGGAGGQGATPQQSSVDEQYVGQGHGFPTGGNAQGNFGAGGQNPYYTTPSPRPTPSTAPVAACSQTIFIVKDTTVNPVVTKPYPNKLTIPQSDCALVINTDTASHSLGGNSVDAQTSKIFRFGTKKVYSMCIDASTTACTAVTVQ